ncbi:MAG: peptide-methionine (R)-S-oxide reductase MsrB [Salinibacter sp.]
MDRRSFLNHLAWASLAPVALSACTPSQSSPPSGSPVASDSLWVHTRPKDLPALNKSKKEWRSIVSEDEFRILFEAGTEPRGSSPLLDEKRTGTYICAACRLPLFSSKTKFESGTGWPSFWAPLEGQVETKKDTKLGYPRTEYHCKRCGGHQGHVFEDGPEPTGLRYCNNGLALDFVSAEKPLPPLRT